MFRAATPAQRQQMLERAIGRHSTKSGEQLPDFAEPLTEAELKAGGGYAPAITSVDCTPRPRYGESQAAFEARMAGYGREMEVLRSDVKTRNRRAALRWLWKDGRIEQGTEPTVRHDEIAAY